MRKGRPRRAFSVVPEYLANLGHKAGSTAYMMAFGAMMARERQSRDGGSWHVRVSLAQTGRWLWNLGRLDGGLNTPDLTGEAVHAAFIESMPSGFGMLKAVRHSALL